MADGPDKYFVFADDRQAYGPANSELLQQWARDGLISEQSWVFHELTDVWTRADKVAILKGLLVTAGAQDEKLTETGQGGTGLRVGQMRRIRLFADMSDEQVEEFLGMIEKVKVRSFQNIVRQGEHGDSMYLILDGEARVSVKLDGKEDTIAMLGAGDFFGEVAVLDDGPRSADVVANKDCTLLKLSKKSLQKIIETNAQLAALFLLAMNRFLGGRIRATNDRFTKAQNFARGAAGEVRAPSSMKWVKARET